MGRRRPGSIDIGANVGDSVVIVRDVSDAPILCIDADPRFHRYLKINTANLSDVTVLPPVPWTKHIVGLVD